MATIHPNRRGLEATLATPESQAAVNDLAEALADKVRAEAPMVEGVPGNIELPVKVNKYESDRSRATVWLAHPAGLAVQAKHGLLSKAASELGLEVHSD